MNESFKWFLVGWLSGRANGQSFLPHSVPPEYKVDFMTGHKEWCDFGPKIPSVLEKPHDWLVGFRDCLYCNTPNSPADAEADTLYWEGWYECQRQCEETFNKLN